MDDVGSLWAPKRERVGDDKDNRGRYDALNGDIGLVELDSAASRGVGGLLGIDVERS